MSRMPMSMRDMTEARHARHDTEATHAYVYRQKLDMRDMIDVGMRDMIHTA